MKFTNEEFIEMFRKAVIEAYIKVMGVDKWNALTDEQKAEVLHAAVVEFTKDMNKES